MGEITVRQQLTLTFTIRAIYPRNKRPLVCIGKATNSVIPSLYLQGISIEDLGTLNTSSQIKRYFGHIRTCPQYLINSVSVQQIKYLRIGNYNKCISDRLYSRQSGDLTQCLQSSRKDLSILFLRLKIKIRAVI